MKKEYHGISIEIVGDVLVREDHLLKYRYLFNQKTGLSVRSSVLDEAGQETQEEVFAARFPHLIDVGVMGHCSHGKSGLCLQSGVQCYQDGFNISEENMSIEDFTKIAEECSGLCNQFALGGRGDPNEHENFKEMLEICANNNIIPNYTTSGFSLSDEQIALTKKFCGAVAVSWYRSSYTIEAIQRFIDAGVKTNIHYVLNTDTIDEAIHRLRYHDFPEGINAVILLTHKPIGLGERSKCISHSDPRFREILSLIKQGGFPFRIGIDGCFAVGMINSDLNFNTTCLDVCGACRFTCYISPNMMLSPCSFNKDNKNMIDLRKTSIWDAWNGPVFERVRNIRKGSCPECQKRRDCYGGCFLYDEIVLCPNKEKKGERV